jgi:type III pantothenate kinase
LNLYVDIGNSLTKLVGDKDGFDKVTSIVSDADTLEASLSVYFENLETPEQIFVANVAGRKLAKIVSDLCEKKFSVRPQFLKVSRESGKVRNGYTQYQQLGVDRWAAIVAAWNKYKCNVFVVDCGSAITLDLVQDSGEHLGGFIIPGNRMMIQALIKYTADVSTTITDDYSGIPGRSTAECVSNATIDAIVSYIEYKFSSLTRNGDNSYICIITGGGANNIMDRLSITYNHEPLLVFEGMKIITGAGL